MYDARFTRYAQRAVYLFDGHVVDENRIVEAEKELRESGFQVG